MVYWAISQVGEGVPFVSDTAYSTRGARHSAVGALERDLFEGLIELEDQIGLVIDVRCLM